MGWRPAVIAAMFFCGAPAEAARDSAAGALLQISGEVQQGGLRGTFSRIFDPATGRFSESVDLGVIRMGSGFDGSLAWSSDISGASHYLNSEFARHLAISEAWLATHPARTIPTRVSLRLSPAGGAPIDLRYDPKSGRLDRAMLQYPENRIIHHYSDWRRVAGGKMLPFRQRDEDPEDESETIYTVRRVTPARHAAFAPSPRPHDSRIVGGKSTTIAFEDDDRRRIYLPVYLDGKGPFAFELDNGGHFILTQETAAALGLNAQGSFASTGAGNEVRQAGYARIGKLRVGSAEIVDQPAKVMALSHNDRGSSPPRAGILGLEFFERFLVSIDHRKKTVTLRLLGESSSAHPGRPLALLFDEDAPLAAGSFAGIKGNVMLDIGNAGGTIIEDYWASRHGLRPRLSNGLLKGSAWLSAGTVGVGPFSLTGESVRYFGPAERGSEYTWSVAAILGEPLLSRFNAVYDYDRQTVWLDPLPEVKPLSPK